MPEVTAAEVAGPLGFQTSLCPQVAYPWCMPGRKERRNSLFSQRFKSFGKTELQGRGEVFHALVYLPMSALAKARLELLDLPFG